VFPTIFYNYSISYVLNNLNIHTSDKRLVFDLNYTTKSLNFVKILKTLSLINKFFVYTRKERLYIKIYAYYFRNINLVKKFKLISKPSKSFYVSLKALTLLNKRSGSSIFLISTSKGMMSHKMALKQNLSGIMVGFSPL
jgi:ribosomal protein S8